MNPLNERSLVVYVPNMVGLQEFSSTSSIPQRVQPLNAYEIDIMKPIVKELEMQMDIYSQELKELEEPKDPEHMFAMVAFEDVANEVLATRPPPKFSAFERRMNWKMHLRKRVDNQRYEAVRLLDFK
ncbi:hypothetical protein TSUD_176520 [Trifolium subterraneum]|uniref:Uncharacterized protein n=1 Tax=Trifolium subterraneum TaxID=3900 RepID=A0A2Z6MY85_TRISU|nr:hypothetical protein TSUD_176520 [Trifolium subterraneum]